MIYLKAFADTILGGLLLLTLMGYVVLKIFEFFFGIEFDFIFLEFNSRAIPIQIIWSFIIGFVCFFLARLSSFCFILYLEEFNKCLESQKQKQIQKSIDQKKP